ncbi:MAG: hypothetical protein ACI9OJ_005500 [Myxococcota bacterium]|jgi:hypothetical protein
MVGRETHPIAQKLALQSLAHRPEPTAALNALNQLMSSGQLNSRNAGDALTLLKRLESELGAQQIWQTADSLRQARLGDRVARNQIQSWVEGLTARL